jgi:hypothetical protein
VIERLFRVENLVVIPLLLVAVLVALGARWRNDPQRGHVAGARAITMTLRIGLVVVVATIVLFFLLLLLRAPIGP